jgi:general secretion pathway protein N
MRVALPFTLIGLSVLTIGAIVYETMVPLDPVTVELPPMPTHIAPLAAPRPFVPPPEEAYGDIDARPLFSADRKPLTDNTQIGAVGNAADLSLVGVIMDGERAIALLRNKSTSQTESATMGGTVEGWHVAHIDATSVTLSANGNQTVVALEGPADRPASAALPEPVQQAAPPPAAPVSQPPPLTSAPTQQASAPPAAPVGPPAPGTATPAKPAPPTHSTIAPEALKGAFRDPKTGEPTL